MTSNPTWCCRCVGEIKNMIKYGKTKSANQRYICKFCRKTRVENYTYQAYKLDINKNIIQFTKEGLGIRSTARLLRISTTTLLKRIISIARLIRQSSAETKLMKLMKCALISGTKEILSDWFMLWKRILKLW